MSSSQVIVLYTHIIRVYIASYVSTAVAYSATVLVHDACIHV